MLFGFIAAAMAISGVLMWGLSLYHRSEAAKPLHIRAAKKRPFDEARFRKNAAGNSALSFVMVFGVAFVVQDWVFDPGPASVGRVIGEGVAVLLIYDFYYYFLHRFPFHTWKSLRQVHAVHHVVKNPTAQDSLYQHPMEAFSGLALMWCAVATITLVHGPMSIYAFGWFFAVYSALNVLVHAGLQFRKFPGNVISYLGVRHYKHHASMRAGNYASLVPLYDIVFGTEER